MKTIVRNGRIATGGSLFEGDISIEQGIIKEIGTELQGKYDVEIHAGGKLVIPGGVDVHTHFNLHTGSAVARDDFYTGTVAAACGGTTTIVDHMGFGPAGCGLDHQLKVYHEYAEGNAVVDYSFHGVIQHMSLNMREQLEEMIVDHGISSFKLYLTYDYRLQNEEIIKLMQSIRKLGGLLTVHAENHEIIQFLREEFIKQGKTAPIYHAKSRPDYCEGEAVNRLLALSAAAGDVPLYIVHLTTAQGLLHIREARKSGRQVYAETCPQYLLLNEDCYQREDGLKYILSPPLRQRHHSEALWQGLREGHIQVVATDHCPFNLEEDKKKGEADFTQCPNGLPGVEERLPLLFSEGVLKNRLSLNRFIEVCCSNPAKLFGLYPRKGCLLPGSDGDLVIIDPEAEVTLSRGMLHSDTDYTAYEGFKLKGYPVMTLSRGEVIVHNNEYIGDMGRGRFLKRNEFPRGGDFDEKL